MRKKLQVPKTSSKKGDHFVWAFLIIASLFFSSCKNKMQDKTQALENSAAKKSKPFETVKPVDAAELELRPLEYVNWLRSNNGLTYTEFENDSILLSIMYQPAQLQAAMGIGSSNMSYDQLLISKKGFHYFFVEALYKEKSATKNTRRKEFLNRVKNSIYIIKNDADTLKNGMLESFTSAIMDKPDNLMIMIPDGGFGKGLICSIAGEQFGLNEIKIEIPEKQFALFPKLKI